MKPKSLFLILILIVCCQLPSFPFIHFPLFLSLLSLSRFPFSPPLFPLSLLRLPPSHFLSPPLLSFPFYPFSPPVFMTDKGRPLPKFGEWDVNDPSSAEGFTVIFNKARDEKKTGGKPDSPPKKVPNPKAGMEPHKAQPKKWLCCVQAPDVHS